MAATVLVAVADPRTVLAVPGAASAPDTLRVSLSACVERALAVGEELQDAGINRAVAHARYLQARSSALPQLSLDAGYTRQLENIYDDQGSTLPPFVADTTAAMEDRLRSVEEALPGSGFYALSQLFRTSAFASENAWSVGLNLSQKIFQGGSIWGSIAAARHAMKSAELLFADRTADAVYFTRAAYLQALLAERREHIAALAIEQAEIHLREVRLNHEAGDASEYELLKAEVTRDNQVPLLKAAHSARDLAYLELRRLCNLESRPLRLTSPLLEDTALPADPAAVDTVGLEADALVHAGVAALEEAVQARGHAITVAAAEKYPELSLFAGLSQQAFPEDVFPAGDAWLRSEHIGVAVSWSLFDGFLTKGAIREAEANRDRAVLELRNARELVRMAVAEGRLEL
jgi:outer membrane protein TolC